MKATLIRLEDVERGDARFRDWMRRYREEVNGEAPPDHVLNAYVDMLFQDQGRNRHVWWGIEQGRRIGFAVATLQRGMIEGRSQGMIAEFFIYPEFRREGAGRRLAQTVIDTLKAAGASDVYSVVVAGNVRGLRFWEACGFQIARYSLVHRPEARLAEEDEEEEEKVL